MGIDELDLIISRYIAKYPAADHIRNQLRIRMFFEKGFSVTTIANRCVIEEKEVYVVLRNRRTHELDRHLLALHSIANGDNNDDLADANFPASVIQYAASRYNVSDIRTQCRRREIVDARTIAVKVLIHYGFSHTEVASWLGISRCQVYYLTQKDVSCIPPLMRSLNDCMKYAEAVKKEFVD